jgi:D-alanyl-D-alanine carboxypeptidase/D-alanyl-D-alanine-endopeptidase (penicillin-binding protein 4)
MKKYLLFTTCLMLLIFWPIQAQEIVHAIGGSTADSRPLPPERFTTLSENNYLNELALRGFTLDGQGLLVESLDGTQIFADLNSNVGFNPASVTKIATSFTALYKFGPEYHFETAFYADGEITKKNRTLNGDLVLFSTGDPILTATDLTRMIHEVVAAGISRVNGNFIIAGPFTYNTFLETSAAAPRMEALLKKLGVRYSGSWKKGSARGSKIASHTSQSLRDILFVQNAHSVNQTAERLGEAVGGPPAVEKFLVKEIGLMPTEVSLTHTSGLDYNRITPHGVVLMLRHLVSWLNLHNMLPEDIMPVAGIDPGTLRGRLTTIDYRGAVVAKTGTLPGTDGGVSTLAGIMYTRDRGPIVFAIFNSHGPVHTYRRMQDNLLRDLISECGGSQLMSATARRSNN